MSAHLTVALVIPFPVDERRVTPCPPWCEGASDEHPQHVHAVESVTAAGAVACYLEGSTSGVRVVLAADGLGGLTELPLDAAVAGGRALLAAVRVAGGGACRPAQKRRG